MMNARQAFQNLNSGVPGIVSATEALLKAKQVASAYQNPEKPTIKGKFLEFCQKYGLLTSTPTAVRGGGNRGVSVAAVKAVAGAKFEQWQTLTADINKALEAAKSTFELQPYIRNLSPKPKAAVPTPTSPAGAKA